MNVLTPKQSVCELLLLNYRLRTLRARGILTLPDQTWGIKTLSESTLDEYPEDPVVKKLLEADTPEEVRELCLWHILWQMHRCLPFAGQTTEGLLKFFPSPVKGFKCTIHTTGIHIGSQKVVYPPLQPEGISKEADECLLENLQGRERCLFRFITWRVKQSKNHTRLHFTVLPEMR